MKIFLTRMLIMNKFTLHILTQIQLKMQKISCHTINDEHDEKWAFFSI